MKKSIEAYTLLVEALRKAEADRMRSEKLKELDKQNKPSKGVEGLKRLFGV